jgi:trans-2-enoyl-CoA reductase
MQALQLSAFGRPEEVVKLVELPEPSAPGTGEVLVAVEASPIHPADLLIMTGYYGYRPSLPTLLGGEGVATVLAVGGGVKEVAVGDRVLLPPLHQYPTWCEQVVIPSQGLFPLPRELDPLQLSMLVVNPFTAYLLLHAFVDVQPGEWIIQNAANSVTGRAVIAVARDAGIQTVNVVRREEAIASARQAGAEVILVDGPDLSKRVTQVTGKASIRLGLEAVGNDAMFHLLECVADGGTIVSYAASRGKPFTGQTALLIFRDLTIRGFWLHKWVRTAEPSEIITLSQRMLRLLQAGHLFTPVEATYPFSRFREALAHATQPQHQGRILFQAG